MNIAFSPTRCPTKDWDCVRGAALCNVLRLRLVIKSSAHGHYGVLFQKSSAMPVCGLRIGLLSYFVFYRITIILYCNIASLLLVGSLWHIFA